MTLRQTDKAVIIACGTIFLTFLIINVWLSSIWLLYPNVLITAGLFGYAILQEKEFSSHLLQSVIFAVAASIIYIPFDWVFSKKVVLFDYPHPDIPWVPIAPLGLVLTWIIAITVGIYLYERLNTISGNVYISTGVTSVAILVGSTTIIQLGSAHLWDWKARSVSLLHIGAVPIFVPVSLFFTFLLLPYYFFRQKPIVAGMRCGIFMGMILFACFLLFRR